MGKNKVSKTWHCRICGTDISDRYHNAKCCLECRRKHKNYSIERACSVCGKKLVTCSARLKEGRGKFCSSACYWESLKGKPAHNWSRVKKTCETCGSAFYVKRALHLKGWGKFCSRACHAISLRGKPGLRKGKKFTAEQRLRLSKIHKKRFRSTFAWNKGKSWKDVLGKEHYEKFIQGNRERLLERYKCGKFPNQIGTNIELLFKKELMRRGYKENSDYFHQYIFYDKFLCDFVFPAQKLIVECDGDFWHANPVKYEGKELKPAQKRTLAMDKSKNAYVRKVDNGSWTLIRVWESDIRKDVEACVDKIEKVLKTK